MAHAPAAQKELGRIVADAKAIGRAVTREEYQAGFMKALAKPAKAARHTNALQHMLGYFKKLLTPAEKAEVVGTMLQAERSQAGSIEHGLWFFVWPLDGRACCLTHGITSYVYLHLLSVGFMLVCSWPHYLNPG